MDFGALPPEINSGRIYAGPGSAPMLAAASSWDKLAAELSSAAAAYQSTITGLVSEGWTGPASTAMAAAATPYITWMNTAAGRAEQTAVQAKAAAAAFDAVFAMTVAPPLIVANRSQLAMLVATNFLGINAAAIAATEASYSQMWAQDAAAMYGYAAASAAAAQVTPFSAPPQTTNPAGRANQDVAVNQAAGSAAPNAQSTLSQAITATPNTLQQLSSPLQAASPTPAVPDFLNPNDIQPGDFMNSVSNFMSSSASPMSVAGVTGAAADMAVLRGAAIAAGDPLGLGAIDPFTPMLPGMGAGLGGGLGGLPGFGGALGAGLGGNGAAAAAVGQASSVGALSVPQAWAAAIPTTNATAAVPATGWTVAAHAPEPGAAGMPGMPLAGAGTGRNYGFAAPRYGFKPTVMARPVVAG